MLSLSLPHDVLVSILVITHFEATYDTFYQEEQVNAHVTNHKSHEGVTHTLLSILVGDPIIVESQNMVEQNDCCDFIDHFKSEYQRSFKRHCMCHVNNGHEAAKKLRHNLEVKFLVEDDTHRKDKAP